MDRSKNDDLPARKWRYPALFLLMLIPATAIIAALHAFATPFTLGENQPRMKQGVAPRQTEPTGDRHGCETVCAKAFLERMKGVSEKAHRNVQTALCGPHLENRQLWKTDYPMLIGAGQGSSGTRALSAMTTILGLKTFHFDHTSWPVEFPRVKTIWGFEEYLNLSFSMEAIRDSQGDWHNQSGTPDFATLLTLDAIFDTPFPEFLTETLETFPNASVLLSVRDAKDWRTSRLKQVVPRMPYPHPCDDYLRDNTEEQVVLAYEATNDYIRCIIPEERFVEVNHIEDDDFEVWSKLIKLMERRGKISPHAQQIAENCELPMYFEEKFSCAIPEKQKANEA